MLYYTIYFFEIKKSKIFKSNQIIFSCRMPGINIVTERLKGIRSLIIIVTIIATATKVCV